MTTPSRAREIARHGFATEGLTPSVWSNGPGAEYAAHEHARHKVLYCIEGSIVFQIDDKEVPLGPGDRLDLPAGTTHTATVGPEGITCWEAFRS